MQSFPSSFGDPGARRQPNTGGNPLMMSIGNPRPQGPGYFQGVPPQQGFPPNSFNGHGGQREPGYANYPQNQNMPNRSKSDYHDYYMTGGNAGQNQLQLGQPGLPGSLGYSQSIPGSPQGHSGPSNGFNPLQRNMRPGTGGALFPPQDPFSGSSNPYGLNLNGQAPGQQAYSGFNNLGNSGVLPGAPGPRGQGNENFQFGPRGQVQGGIPPNNLHFKQAPAQSPMNYGHPHNPIHAIGDPNDPLSTFRANPARVDLEHESRGKVGYSPKPKREEFAGNRYDQHQSNGEKLIQSQLTFDHDPMARRAPPKPILKRTGNSMAGRRPKSAKFNQDVLVHEVESWKIYNVDMAKEAKKNFRRESQSECRLV